jgi:hypothetical protein
MHGAHKMTPWQNDSDAGYFASPSRIRIRSARFDMAGVVSFILHRLVAGLIQSTYQAQTYADSSTSNKRLQGHKRS